MTDPHSKELKLPSWGTRYKADGLRISKTIDGVTTRQVWDGSNISAEISDNTVTNKYTRGINLIKDNVNFFVYNAHGDVVQLLNTSGIITKSYKYDAFGNERNVNESDTNPWRYCGEYYDSSSGTYYLRARYYVPSTGRFTSEDPIRSGLNWYTYCYNDPVNYIDPSGLIAVIGADGVVRDVDQNDLYVTDGTTTSKVDPYYVVAENSSGEQAIYSQNLYMPTDIYNSWSNNNYHAFVDTCVQIARANNGVFIFGSTDATAIGFGNAFLDASIKANKEYGAWIYSGGGGYYSGPLFIGTARQLGDDDHNFDATRNRRATAAWVHTHGNNPSERDLRFSNGDALFAANYYDGFVINTKRQVYKVLSSIGEIDNLSMSISAWHGELGKSNGFYHKVYGDFGTKNKSGYNNYIFWIGAIK